MAAKMSTQGSSPAQIAMTKKREIRTVEEWLNCIEKKSETFHIFLCSFIKLTLKFLQMDELGSFLKGKTHPGWIFTALDVPTRFWIHFEVGSRTNLTASRLVSQIKSFGHWSSDHVLKITTELISLRLIKLHFLNILLMYHIITCKLSNTVLNVG